MRENQKLNLTGDLTYATVHRQRSKILEFLNHSNGMVAVVNLAEVRHSDSAGVALLIEIIKIAARKQKQITFQHLTQQMKAMVKFCNLNNVIDAHIGN